jgi:hypothetical protein
MLKKTGTIYVLDDKKYTPSLYRNVPKQTTRVEQKKTKEILIE